MTLVGTRQSVLVEGPGKTGLAWEGRTERNEIVHVEGSPSLAGTGSGGRDLAGEILEVEITQAFKHSLAGRATPEGLAALPPVVPGDGKSLRPARRRRALPIAAV